MTAAFWLAAFLLLGAGGAQAEEPARFVDYVYVDANEGSASGGHVALRLGDRTFHFGYQDPGVLRIDRSESERFDRVYGMLENRNREISRLRVSSQTFDLLRSSFNERYLRETAEFALLEGLARDRQFFLDWREGSPGVALRGAGYFRTQGAGERARGGNAISRLRARVLRHHGEDFLARRISEARAELDALPSRAENPASSLAAPGQHPSRGYGLSAAATDARGRIEAFTVLRQGATLDPRAVVRLDSGDFAIDRRSHAWMAAFAQRLEGELADAAASSRPDSGFVLLVGMARLLALEETMRSGQLVVLDVFPFDSFRLSVAEVEARGGRLSEITPQVQAELQRVGEVVATNARVRESDYAALEAIVNRYAELTRAQATGADLRASPGRLLPERARRRQISFKERPADAVLERRVAELEALADTQSRRLDDAHHYNILTHNCASEIFAQIERAFAEEGASASEVSRARLGGHVPPGRGLEFIPFVAADTVQSHYELAGIEKIPSYRVQRVEEMASREGGFSRLRESNTLTSTVYAPNRLDSSFLFFTDDVFLLRPFFGVANIFYGLGAAVVGLPLAPFDHANLLVSGLRGVAFSVPELAFANIRKGSFFSVSNSDGTSAGGDVRLQGSSR